MLRFAYLDSLTLDTATPTTRFTTNESGCSYGLLLAVVLKKRSSESFDEKSAFEVYRRFLVVTATPNGADIPRLKRRGTSLSAFPACDDPR
jgi:hypothetical protein